MVYLDYSATTPVDRKVLDTFCRVSLDFVGNANSIHALGVESKKMMDMATEQVADILHVKKDEVIFTSSSSESNNFAIFGVLSYYKNRGKQIITTPLEHPSILETLSYASFELGYEVSYVSLKEDGTVDIDSLKKLLEKDTVLVSIGYVNSEVGILQPIDEIGKLLKDYPRTIFHVDGTQAVGKIPVSLDYVDLFSFSAHKFYGLKGIACLIKKSPIQLTPLIHGGKSQTIYRSGTPSLALMVSLAKALRLAIDDLPSRLKRVKENYDLLMEKLSQMPFVVMNSNTSSIPYIVNISIPSIKPETLIHALEQDEIYVSTQTACSDRSSISSTLAALSKDPSISGHSIRISLSHLTTSDEILFFLKKLEEHYHELNLEKRED